MRPQGPVRAEHLLGRQGRGDEAAQGAPIDAYGVGTRMAVSYDAPSLDRAYKLVAVGDGPVLKLSPGKATRPGPKQVFRDPGGDSGDVVGLRERAATGRPPTAAGPGHGDGRRVGPAPGEVRERHRFDADLAWLPEAARRLAYPTPLTATVSPALTALHRRIAERRAPTSTGAVRRNGR
ncbi:hypothetical protein NCC78_01935 [Micromonospora phytophila]|nr:hypothetical protein [Micromonospora phytophila]